jgi:hypothetical protein
MVDGTIMVVRAWRTHKKLVRDAVTAIGKEKFVGIIVNDARDALNEYGYYGYYGYDYRSSSKTKKKSGSRQSDSQGGSGKSKISAVAVDRFEKNGSTSNLAGYALSSFAFTGRLCFRLFNFLGKRALRIISRPRASAGA